MMLRLMCAALVMIFAVCALAACNNGKTAGTEIEDQTTATVSSTEAAGALKVSLTADGKTSEVSTSAATVKALLNEQKITLGKDDEVSPKLDAKLTADLKIVVKRVSYKEETKTEAIKFSKQEKYSSSMEEGTSEVTRKGVNGEKTVTYKVKYVDGKEDSREKINEEVTKEPVDEITTYGTASSDNNDSNNNNSDDNDNDNDDGDDDGNSGGVGGVYEVSRQDMPDCDGSGHGYYIVTWSNGEVTYEDY